MSKAKKEEHSEAHPKAEEAHSRPEPQKVPKLALVPSGCMNPGCKTKPERFGFCEEHYDQFKFGLIKKTGEPVPDYEKKIEHYMAMKARGVRKAA